MTRYGRIVTARPSLVLKPEQLGTHGELHRNAAWKKNVRPIKAGRAGTGLASG